jgi:Ala-tRNA(Pro) deacylase
MTSTRGMTGFQDVQRLLDARGLDYALIEHHPTFTAGAEGRVAAVPPAHTAKAVMTCDAHGHLLAIIPACDHLDLKKLRRAASRPALRLATERELATDFPQFELGALPPFGELFDCSELIDVRLLGPSRILCNGGDHRHSFVVRPDELRYASGSGIADLIADEHDRSAQPNAR